MLDHKPLQHGNIPGGDFSAANVDNRNVAAQAGGAAAKVVGDKQRMGDGGSVERTKDVDPSVIERIVAEERESKGKLPRYPGLERWTLLEKMGDGAFSNVYRAKETNGHGPEVAIKVVRKFEMNSTQVSMGYLLATAYLSYHISHSLLCIQRYAMTLHLFVVCDGMPISGGAIGRQTSTPGFQEATKSRGG